MTPFYDVISLQIGRLLAIATRDACVRVDDGWLRDGCIKAGRSTTRRCTTRGDRWHRHTIQYVPPSKQQKKKRKTAYAAAAETMKASSIVLFLLVLLDRVGSTWSSSFFNEFDDDSSSSDGGSELEEEDDALLIESNPHYVGLTGDDDTDDEGGDGDDKKKRQLQSKAAMKKALAKHRKKKSKKNKGGAAGLAQTATAFFKKNHLKITLVVAAYAFRKEILKVLWHLVSKPVRDPKTGKWVRRPVAVSPTAILKILVFIDMARRLQSLSGGGNGKTSPLTALALAGSKGNPALAMILFKILSPSHSAYVPPVQQHYTFERVNDRYTKDKWALDKVMDSGGSTGSSLIGASSAAAAAGGGGAMDASKLAKLFTHTKEQKPTYNETVIVMDWTDRLDGSVSQIGVIRDEVSFLLNAYDNSTTAAASSEKQQQQNNTNSTTTDSTVYDQAQLEVIVLLESPGGSAADYALASEQILRMRRRGMKVTICVDKVAASGTFQRLFCVP